MLPTLSFCIFREGEEVEENEDDVELKEGKGVSKGTALTDCDLNLLIVWFKRFDSGETGLVILCGLFRFREEFECECKLPEYLFFKFEVKSVEEFLFFLSCSFILLLYKMLEIVDDSSSNGSVE